MDDEDVIRALDLTMDEVLRQSGHFGPKVEVPDDADPTTRLMGFIGRR